MHSRYTKALVSIVAVAAVAAPGIAQASHGSDDPPSHVRREHHRFEHHRRGSDDVVGHDRRGSDDGPNHR
jgi:hypothetical protein